MRDNEIPNLKASPCHIVTGTEGLFKIAILNGSGDTPPPHA